MKKFFTLFTLMAMIAMSSQAAIYLVGNEPLGKGWDPSKGVEMTANSDGTYSFTATITSSVWFCFADQLAATSSDWDTFNSTYRFGPVSGDQTVTIDTWTTTQRGSGAYKFTGTGGEYTVTFDPVNMQFKISGYVAPLEFTSYTVAGTPTSAFGTEWDATNTNNDMTNLGGGKFELNKYGVELSEGSDLAFKIVGNHDWGFAWPEENYVYPITESGVYNLTFSFDSISSEVGVVAELVSNIDPKTGNLFVLGEVSGNGWAPNVGYPLVAQGNEVYKGIIETTGANYDEADGQVYSYFSFSTLLADNEDDWGSITAYRLGAIEDSYMLSDDQLGIEVALSNFGSTYSFKALSGKIYEVVVDLNNLTMVITPYGGETLPGDVNGDNEVNIGDVNAIIDAILSGAANAAADVNGDNEINIGDVNYVIDLILNS